MPRRPMALQKVYAAELLFFGQSFKICEDTREVKAPPSQPPSAPSRSLLSGAIYEMTLQMEGEDEAHLMSQRRHWL